MNDLMINPPVAIEERTPLVIAAEINMIKYQIEKMLLHSIIEIGRRLTEVKKQMPYGEWGQWLKASVNYSQKTAENFMRIFDAYDTQKLQALTADPGSQSLPKLSYTQALILLGIPEEERADFIAQLDIESMSTRELQRAINDKNQALQEKDEAVTAKTLALANQERAQAEINQVQAERDQALVENQNLKKQLDDRNGQILQLTQSAEELNHAVSEYRERCKDQPDGAEAKEKETEAKEAKGKEAEEEKSSKEEQIKNRIMKHEELCSTHCKSIRSAFEALTVSLSTLNKDDPEVKEVKRKAAHEMMKNLTKTLEEWPPVTIFSVS